MGLNSLNFDFREAVKHIVECKDIEELKSFVSPDEHRPTVLAVVHACVIELLGLPF